MSSRALGFGIGTIVANHLAGPQEYQLRPDLIEVLTQIVLAFSGKIFVIFRVDVGVENEIQFWLWQKDFFKKTKLNAENLEFIRPRKQGEEQLCLKAFSRVGITDYVDTDPVTLNALKAIDFNNHWFFCEEGFVFPETKLLTSWEHIKKQFIPASP